jgi:exodeoxyribonuclease VII small subunit
MASKKQDESFEALFTQLEERARRLEQGNLPLEESLALYEEGAALVDRLRQVLDAAELRIRNVQGRFEEDIGALREVESEFGDEEQ